MPVELTEVIEETLDSDTDATSPAPVSEISCQVCGKDIAYLYKGRGRKPTKCEEHRASKPSKLGTAKSTKNVDSACAAMSMMYDILSTALLMIGARKSMRLFAESREELDEKNRKYLANDPALAARLANMGRTGGRYAFISAQVMTVGPVFLLAAGELRERSAERAARQDSENPGIFESEIPGFVNGIPVDDAGE